jgi:hypothetical protein
MLHARVAGRTKIAGTSTIGEQLGKMRRRTAARLANHWAIVLVTMATWILLSNHCALGLSGATTSGLEPGVCPMHSGPAKEKPAANIPCCKELRAVAAHVTKSVTAAAKQLVGAWDYTALIFPARPHVTLQLVSLDTGPPRSLSFAESVLQRSILAHAPPAGFPRV